VHAGSEVDVAARLDGGAIVDDVVVDGDEVVTVRFRRCTAGWQAEFEVRHVSIGDLAVVHRLVAPSLADAKVAVPQAIRYLLGRPADAPSFFV
jgi:hypothetical protein